MFPASFWYLVVGQALQSLALSALSLGLIFVGVEESNPTGIGLVLAARTLPTMVLSLLGGVAADKYNRVRLASITLVVSGFLHLVLAFSLTTYGLGWQVYAISLATGLISAFGAPSLYALLPQIVPAEHNVRANAIARGSRNVMSVIGPLLVGILVPLFGTDFLFYLVAALIVIAGICISQIRDITTNSPTTEAGDNDDDVNGTAESKHTAVTISNLRHKYPWFIFSITSWSILLFLESGATAVTLPFTFLETGTSSQWTLTLSATSLGYIAGAAYLLRFPLKRNILSLSFLVFPLAILPLVAVASDTSFYVILFACFLAGIGLELSGSLWGSVLQTRISQSEIGRISSLDYAFSFGLIPLAYIGYGALSAAYSGHTILVGSTIVVVLISLMAAWKNRDTSASKP